jgi:Nif-specific regulatory protein
MISEPISTNKILLDVARVLDGSADPASELAAVCETIALDMGMSVVTIMILNRQRLEIAVEEAYGIPKERLSRSVYKPGEGITGRVVELGKPIIIPKIGENRQLLDKSGVLRQREGEYSYLSVPIRSGNEVIGALSADQPWIEGHDLSLDAEIFSILASLISPAARQRQSLSEERHAQEDDFQRFSGESDILSKPQGIIGSSTAMREVYAMIDRVAESDATVLIRGESGTGKELVASAIHRASRRKDGPFVAVNCAALPEGVVESELFGHEKGAFTDAVATRKGRFEMADGGTIFLDEIGELKPQIQVKLLRVIQDRTIERIGGEKPIKVNVRIIAATNRDLEDAIQKNLFREDLYYRLNVFPIHIPPLRERKSDIIQLADHFIERYAKAAGKPILRISTPAIDLMMSYHWPGNVRELENCIERAVLLSSDGVIHGHHLPPSLQSAESTGTRFSGSLDRSIERLERELLEDALKTCHGVMSQAAALLGITERRMGLRVDRYGIDAKKYRC